MTEEIGAVEPPPPPRLLWHRYAGCVTIDKKRNCRVIFNNLENRIDKFFSVAKYGSHEAALAAANAFRVATSDSENLTVAIYESQLPWMTKRIIASFVDGDGCVSVKIGKGNFTVVVGQSQNDGSPDILNYLKELFPAGNIHLKKKRKTANSRFEWEFTICGENALPLLQIMAEYGIIKAPQASLVFNTIMETGEITVPQHYAALALNKQFDEYRKIMVTSDQLDAYYLTGIFMAEGYVGWDKEIGIGLSITQKSNLNLLYAIQDYFGGVGSVGVKAWQISADNAAQFIRLILPYVFGPKRIQCELALEYREGNISVERREEIRRLMREWKKI